MKQTCMALMMVCASLASGVALAQAAYPSKAVTIIVPFPPGGGTDTGARVIAQQLNTKWGQPVIVENRAGGAGILGVENAARAAPDGYRILMGNLGTQSVNPSLYKKLSYNPDTAFTPITLVAELPLVLVVNPSLPVKSTKELIALAKQRPGDLTYSTSGAGGSMHLAAAMFEGAAGTKFMHVPYKGGGPAIQDLIDTSNSRSQPCSRRAASSARGVSARWASPSQALAGAARCAYACGNRSGRIQRIFVDRAPCSGRHAPADRG